MCETSYFICGNIHIDLYTLCVYAFLVIKCIVTDNRFRFVSPDSAAVGCGFLPRSLLSKVLVAAFSVVAPSCAANINNIWELISNGFAKDDLFSMDLCSSCQLMPKNFYLSPSRHIWNFLYPGWDSR